MHSICTEMPTAGAKMACNIVECKETLSASFQFLVVAENIDWEKWKKSYYMSPKTVRNKTQIKYREINHVKSNNVSLEHKAFTIFLTHLKHNTEILHHKGLRYQEVTLERQPPQPAGLRAKYNPRTNPQTDQIKLVKHKMEIYLEH